MHNQPDTLGIVIKSAREKAGITVEALGEKIGITERYLYRIENEGKKPRYDVLYKLIRELSIDSNEIFYPEKQSEDSEIGNLLRMLAVCDNRALQVIKATIQAFMDSFSAK
ncbi:MAG: helix-turn-helix domain-containing protein [Lachnospiraceae bacterium]|nr:helix-turn-helix domain-containing protein [Lachnospiraceae bacterium]